ncbi:MAG: hypothetical protein Q9216_002648 [Gyalolechia sp. 2 TL-2023]
MRRLSDQDQLDLILTQSLIDTDDPPTAEPVPTPLSPIQEVVNRPESVPPDGLVNGSASAVPDNTVETHNAVQDDVVGILNGTLSGKKNQPKRKAENTIDNAIPNMRLGKKRKVVESTSLSNMMTQSKAVKGSLVRPTPRLITREGVGSKSKDVFDMPEESPEPARTRVKAVRASSKQEKKPPTKSSADADTSAKTDIELANSSPREEPKKRGRPPRNPKLQTNAANEASGTTLGSHRTDGVKAPLATNRKRKLPSPHARGANSVAADVSSVINEDKEDEQSNIQVEASDNDLPVGNQELPANRNIVSRESRPVSQQPPQHKLPPRKTRRAKAPVASAPPEMEDQGADEQHNLSQEATHEDPASRTTHQDDTKESPSKKRPKRDLIGTVNGDPASAESSDPSPTSDHENETDTVSQTAQNVEPDLQDSNIVLFGSDEAWQEVLRAELKIGVSKIRGREQRKIPELTTRIIQSLVKRSEDAVRSYESLASKATVEMVDRHQRYLSRTQRKIANLPLSTMLSEDEEDRLIQDIYAHAVPCMVALLKKALETRSPVIATGHNVAILEEIISIQDALLTLCERARKSIAKPETERPIIQPTVTIKAHVETVRAAFDAELDKQRRYIRKRNNEARRLKEREKEECAQYKQAEIRRREKDERDRREWEEVSQKCAGLPGFRKFSSQPQNKNGPEHRRLEEPVANQWSKEQDSDLLTELLAEEHGELPAEERFLRALNAPSLKNKLPMHIKERALGYKEAMEKVLKDQGRQIPQWLLNME